MQNSNSNLNTGRFLRLIAISSVEMLLSIPFSTWVLVQNSQVMVHSQSWADTHYQFSRIVYASINTRSVGAETYALQNFARWFPVFTAFLYFAFFGMQEEAMSGYTSAWEALSRTMGRVARYLTPSTSQ
jgi:pheromone a factor receptor